MLVTDPEHALTVIKQAADIPEVWVDCESEGLRPYHGDRICGIPIFNPVRNESYYLPFRHKEGPNLPISMLAECERFLCGRTIGNHGTKFDIHMFWADGIQVSSNILDSMYTAHLYDENRFSDKLEESCQTILPGNYDYRRAEREMLEKIGSKDNIHKAPAQVVCEYAEQDVRSAHELFHFCYDKLDSDKQRRIAIEASDYIYCTADMERNGLEIDQEACSIRLENLEAPGGPIEQHWNKVVTLSGGKIQNPNSSPQIQKYFGAPSCDKDYLESRFDDPTAEAILDWRVVSRLRANYLQAFLDNLDSNGVVHPSLHLTGTVNSRPSCSGPNLQALPKDDDKWGVKRLVTCIDEDFTLVSLDFNQIELRLLAHYSQDPGLVKAYTEDLDLHQMTADALAVDRDVIAKRTNFSSVYMIGARSLSKNLKVSETEARRILTGWYKTYPRVKPLHAACENFARKNGYIEMWTGRRRHFNAHWELRKAMSSKIQGGVAEIMRRTISNMKALAYQNADIKWCIQVHDELLFRIRTSRLHEVIPEIERYMTNFAFRVPIKCSIKTGKTWGTVKTWKKAS